MKNWIETLSDKVEEEASMETKSALSGQYEDAIAHRERRYAYGDILVMMQKEEKEHERNAE